jgi:hypothetical protein
LPGLKGADPNGWGRSWRVARVRRVFRGTDDGFLMAGARAPAGQAPRPGIFFLPPRKVGFKKEANRLESYRRFVRFVWRGGVGNSAFSPLAGFLSGVTKWVEMKISVIGSGYVGLVSGVCFADFGHIVTCVDKDASKIEALRRGEIPIYEPGLDDLVARNVKQQRLSFSTDLPSAVAESDAVFIAVGTPSRRGDGYADLSYVFAVAEEIATAIKG